MSDQQKTRTITITARTARHAAITAIIADTDNQKMGDLLDITNLETFPPTGGPGSDMTYTTRYTVKADAYDRCLRELEAAGFTPDP